jgi:hypothetical protein
MATYRKFSDALQNRVRAPAPPKAPNPPNVSDPVSPMEPNLGALGGLGGAANKTANPSTPSTGSPVLWGEAEEERAAIVEHDGKIPRAWTEGFARLDPDHSPGDVPRQRWQTFIDDMGRFLDSSFCAVATGLGWGPHDLFGCDRDRPFARLDQCGLLWLLNGNRLIALSESIATIETKAGARQIYRCRPSEPGRVLAWELADGDHR